MASRSKVHPSYKTQYRVTNWPKYDKGLVDRGSLTVWLAPDALRSWTPRSNGRRGGQKRYSDSAIALALQLRLVFSLPWRQTEGLLRSLFVLLELDLDVPDHTTLSRRSRSLCIKPTTRPTSRPIHLIIDATGLKVFGQGEWARARHGSHGAHVGWRKLHLGVDAHGFIVTADLTDNDVADASAFPGLVRKVRSPIKKVTTDGSYDHRKLWQVIHDLGARGIIPLHRGAVLRDEGPARQRNCHLRRIQKVGRAQWRRDSGQHKQAKVENAVGRFKKILGPSPRARCPDGQRVETMMGVVILNRMLELGAPRSVPISA
jgi:hypothetical protein